MPMAWTAEEKDLTRYSSLLTENIAILSARNNRQKWQKYL